MVELTVILKDPERTYRQKHLIYEPFSMCEDDQTIKDCIDKSLLDFPDKPESIQIKVSMEIQ